MSNNVFLISDTHFGHNNTCTLFKNVDGSQLRPFKDADEMDEALIANWNSVVKEHDKVYHLGDVVINKKHLGTLRRLNGSKRLIRGNHDIFKTAMYREYFTEIYGVRVLSDMILSHIPLHRDCITDRFETNVHGHLHGNEVMYSDHHKRSCVDPHYMSVCVEKIDYTPIALEDLRLRIKKRREGMAWAVKEKTSKVNNGAS